MANDITIFKSIDGAPITEYNGRLIRPEEAYINDLDNYIPYSGIATVFIELDFGSARMFKGIPNECQPNNGEYWKWQHI